MYRRVLALLFPAAVCCLISASLAAQCLIQGPSGPVCASALTFSVSNPDDAEYQWDFDGDGEFDRSGTSATYPFPGSATESIYRVELYRDGVSCGTKDVTILPTLDASIGLPVDGSGVLEDNIIRICTGVPNVTISMFNNSSTADLTGSYTIDWGDGSPPETYDNGSFNNSTLLTHTFRGFGFHPVTVSARGDGSLCDNTVEYQVYLGSNPSVGLGTPGNTVGLCAPVTLTFPITGTQNNPSGTEYNIYVNGRRVASYDQRSVPAYYTHTFTESSCGETTSTGNYQNAFDLQIIAANPCGSSTATVEPIEVSEPPVPLFTILDSATCTGAGIVFQNASEINEIVSGNPSRCRSELAASWAITPGTAGREWIIADGNLFNSNRIEVDFNNPGTYRITITVNSPSCGSVSYSEEITVRGRPRAVGAGLSLDTQGECAPGTVSFVNRSEGEGLRYRWTVAPSGGWSFVDGTGAADPAPAIRIDAGGTYSFQLEASNVCGAMTWDTTLTFKGPPVVELATPPDACLSAELNFDNTLVQYDDRGSPITEYYWEFPGAETNTDWQAYPRQVRYSGTGNYGYRVAATNACGTGTASDTLRIVDPAPVQMPPRRTICTAADPVLLQAMPRGGIWSGPGISADGRFRASEAGAGVHTLRYRFGDGQCTVEGEMEIEVFAAPLVDAGPNRAVCLDAGPLTLSGMPAGGRWQAAGNVLNGDQFDPARAGQGVFKLYYRYDDGQGCVGSDSTQITVTAAPIVVADDLVVCESSGALTLPDGQPAGGVWSGPGVSGNRFDPAAAGGAGAYRLTYRYSAGGGCSGEAVVEVSVVGAGSVSAGPDLTICSADAPVDLSPGARPAGGRWRSSGGGITGNMFDPAKVTPGEHLVTYEVGIGNCVLTDTRSIWVRRAPDIDLGQVPTYICDEESQVTLTATPAGGAWSAGPGAVLTGNVFNAAASGPGVYRLAYSVTGTGGCRARKTIDITVGTTPPLAAPDTSYCNGPDRLRLPPATPAGGQWSGPGVEANLFHPERAGGVGAYTLEYRYTSGGCIAATTIRVEVVDPVAVDAGPGDTLCLDDGAVALSGYSPEGGRWSGAGIVDERLGRFDPGAVGVGSHALVYTVGRSGCVQRDTVQVRVVGPLDVSPGPALALCPDDAPLLLAGASPAGGQWSGRGVEQGRFNPAELTPGAYEILYNLTDPATGCVTSAPRQVTVHPRPRVLFSMPPAVCLGDTVAFGNDSQGAAAYRWTFGEGTTSALARPRLAFGAAGSFAVTLIGSNDFGCSDTLQRTLQVAAPPEALFLPDADRGCGALTVRFDNRTVVDGVTYRWTFGNGEQRTGARPDPVVFAPGRADTSYVVTLTAQNQCGTASFRDTIHVLPLPTADFGTDVDTSCSPMRVELANRSAGRPEYYHWDLGNGRTSTDSVPPPQTYLTDTTVAVYTITLIAGNTCGTDTLSRNIVVKPVDVNAFFNIPSREGCAPFSVPFTNFATRGAMVRWDFGDGNVSSAVNPVHTFATAGTYTIWQYANNGCGADSVWQTINVLPAPSVDFLLPPAACLDQPVTFENRSQGTMGHYWDFGDGDTSQLRSPVHTFREPGVYEITLTGVSGANGCRAEASRQLTILGKPPVDFRPSAREGCTPLVVDFANEAPEGYYYEWNFGDGNTAVTRNPRHTFAAAGAYRVRLTVTDSNGCSTDTTAATITAHPVPVVAFDLDADAFCGLPATVGITNRSRGATGYQWDFGDGSTSTFNNPPGHVYRDGGRYTIRLIAGNAFQCADTLERQLDVFPPPEARYEIDNHRGCTPLDVDFINRSSANHYYWDFGDGNGSTDPSPGHRYERPGKYDVRLIVSYNDICYDTLELRGEVEAFPTPRADFDFAEDRGGPPGSIELINRSQGATAWRWSFGDGGTSIEENPRHRYLFNGTKQVRLEASNVYGCRHDTLRIIHPPFIKGLFVPNAFSPEAGIGEVRLFMPKGVGLKEYRIQVFSPYGELVWESNELADGTPAEAWDGTMNGRLLPQDVYVWKAYAIFEDGTAWRGMPDGAGRYKTIGSVTLLR